MIMMAFSLKMGYLKK